MSKYEENRKLTLTASEVGCKSHLIKGDVGIPSILDFLDALGIEVIPDEEEETAPRIEFTESQVEAIGRDAVNYFTPGGTWGDWARAVFMSADFAIVEDREPSNPYGSTE